MFTFMQFNTRQTEREVFILRRKFKLCSNSSVFQNFAGSVPRSMQVFCVTFKSFIYVHSPTCLHTYTLCYFILLSQLTGLIFIPCGSKHTRNCERNFCDFFVVVVRHAAEAKTLRSLKYKRFYLDDKKNYVHIYAV